MGRATYIAGGSSFRMRGAGAKMCGTPRTNETELSHMRQLRFFMQTNVRESLLFTFLLPSDSGLTSAPALLWWHLPKLRCGRFEAQKCP